MCFSSPSGNIANEVKRPIAIWLAAVVPATLAGHAAAYALCACSAAERHHGWMMPVLEASLAMLIGTLLICAGTSLVRARILTRTRAERSVSGLWVRLAVCQTSLFTAIESAEGGHLDLRGILVQIGVALVAAYLLWLFAGLLEACAHIARAASSYLERLHAPVATYAPRCAYVHAHALAVRAGTSRFQRPPPAAALSH